jgi:hypothetical protein
MWSVFVLSSINAINFSKLSKTSVAFSPSVNLKVCLDIFGPKMITLSDASSINFMN